MPRRIRKNHGLPCLGIWRGGGRCRLARDGSGAAWLNRPCLVCKEQRCKKHCLCGRKKEQRRQASVVSASSSAARRPALAPVAVVAPVGRAPAPSCELLEDASELIQKVCSDIEAASEVELSSYMYDNPDLHKVLLERLQGKARRPFSLSMYIDAEQFKGRTPKAQKSRVTQLRGAGAKVYVCKGKRGLGAYHCKALVVDRRYLYTGSMNFTTKSVDNEELPFRMTGPVVLQVLARLAVHRQRFGEPYSLSMGFGLLSD